jgi:Holliday junction resolvase RusA-like endonuclease
MSELKFTLPVPPSANALFTYRAGSRQRIKTDAYRLWIIAAGWAISRASAGSPMFGPAAVEIALPFNRQRDIDNAIKPLLDLLVRHQIVKDDRWIDDLRVRRVATTEPLTVTVRRL